MWTWIRWRITWHRSRLCEHLRLVSYTKTQISLKRSGTNVHTKKTCVEDASTHPFILTRVSMMLCLCLFPFTPSNQSPEWTNIFFHCCLSLQSCSYPACFFSPVPVFTGEHCISIVYETLSAPSPAQSETVSGCGSVLSNELEVVRLSVERLRAREQEKHAEGL